VGTADNSAYIGELTLPIYIYIYIANTISARLQGCILKIVNNVAGLLK